VRNKFIENIRLRAKNFFDIITHDSVRENLLQALPFWIASLITGIVAVAYTKLFTYAEDVMRYILSIHKWYIFLLTPICFLLARLVVRWAPAARGSGIPQVMAAIEIPARYQEQNTKKLLSLKIIVVKILSSLLMVLGGGAIGREGPTIQVAGSIFRLVNRWIPASWPKLSQKSFILTGAAAGLAAAFNTPLGGIVFAIEELARVHISFFRTALFSAVIISGMAAQGFLGPYLYLGYPDVKSLSNITYIGVFVAAVIAGLLGAIMCKLILKLMAWKRTFNNTQSMAFILIAGLAVAAVAFFFNDHVLGSGKDLMVRSLFTQDKYMPWHSVLLRVLGPVVSFNTGAAGGIFAPSLAAGASVGSFLSGLFGVIGANANILILSGMVGFLTGVTRTPFTSAILVLEMTDRHSVIFHLMLAAMVANIAALVIDKHSLYEQLKKQYLEETSTHS